MNKSVTIDWLSFTFTFEEVESHTEFPIPLEGDIIYNHPFVLNLINFLGFKEEEITYFDFGRNRYREKIVLGDTITILFNGPVKKDGGRSAMLEMTGSGCKEFSDREGNWYNLLNFLTKSAGFGYTRLDVATDLIDDKSLTMKWIMNKYNKREFISCMRKSKVISSISKDRLYVANDSYSILFGSPTSTKNLAIYDKWGEQRDKGYEVMCNSWIRFESRFFRDTANEVVYHLLQGRMDDFEVFSTELLNSLIEFKNPGVDKSRIKYWTTANIWRQFIGDIPKFEYTSHHKNRFLKIDKTTEWFKKAAIKSLCLILGVGDTHETGSILSGCLSEKKIMKLTSVDLVAVNEAREAQGKRAYKDVEELKKHLFNVKNNLYSANRYTLDDDNDLPF